MLKKQSTEELKRMSTGLSSDVMVVKLIALKDYFRVVIFPDSWSFSKLLSYSFMFNSDRAGGDSEFQTQWKQGNATRCEEFTTPADQTVIKMETCEFIRFCWWLGESNVDENGYV